MHVQLRVPGLRRKHEHGSVRSSGRYLPGAGWVGPSHNMTVPKANAACLEFSRRICLMHLVNDADGYSCLKHLVNDTKYSGS